MNFIRNRNFRAGPQTSLEGFICPQNSDKQQKIKVFGRSGGGTIHVIASLLAGAEVGTDQLTAPEHSFKREQQLGKVQEKRIESWAKKTGCWVDDTSVYNQTLGDKTHQN